MRSLCLVVGLISFLLLLPITNSSFGQSKPGLILETPEFEYGLSDTISIDGFIRNSQDEFNLEITVTDQEGITVLSESLSASTFFTFEFNLPDCSLPGLYQVTAKITVDGEEITNSESFSATGEVDPDCETRPTVDKETAPPSSTQISIPDWVRNNAGWWADEQISDDEFARGIEFLIKEEIIKVPPTEKQEDASAKIPDWVRNNAGWWADQQISDLDFANGLQYLISHGLISV